MEIDRQFSSGIVTERYGQAYDSTQPIVLCGKIWEKPYKCVVTQTPTAAACLYLFPSIQLLCEKILLTVALSKI